MSAGLNAICGAARKLLDMVGTAGEQADATAPGAEASQPGPPVRAAAAAGGSVLVMDDNEVNRDVPSRRLAR